jgi:stage V sporulation protein S
MSRAAASVNSEDDVLRVKSSSNPQALASSVAHALYDSREPVLRAVGAGAVNQAVKAIAIARGYVAPRGIDIAVVPGFKTITMPDGEASAIVLRVIQF